MSKIAERTQRTLLDLAAQPGNDACADCKARLPRWASWNLGIFICVNCASIHRKIGSHISKVKSLTLDDWTKEQVEHMKRNGNIKSNLFYCPNEVKNPPPTNMIDSERDSELEKYIRAKYEHKRFVDKSAFVAAQLGPSRSAASVASVQRPQSTPLRQASSTIPAPSTLSKSPSLPPTAANAIRPIRSVSQPLEQTTHSQPSVPSPLQQSQIAPSSQSQTTMTNQFQTAPLIQPQLPPQSHPTYGVWSDLASISQPPAPLQFQQPMQQPTLPTNMVQPHMTSFTTPSYQPQYSGGQLGTTLTTNPFFQPHAPTQMMAQPNMLNPAPTGIPMQSQFGQQFFAQPNQAPMQLSPSPQPFLQPQPSIGYNPQPEFLTPSPIPYSAESLSTSPAPFMQTSPSPFAMMQPQQQPQMFGQPQQQQSQDQFTSWLSKGPGARF